MVLKFAGAFVQWCGGPEGALRTTALSVIEEAGAPLVGSLLQAANGNMLSWALIPAVDALADLCASVGVGSFGSLLRSALAADDVPRVGLRAETKETFVIELTASKAQGDKKIFKRLVKTFCGGKKKGDLSSQQKDRKDD